MAQELVSYKVIVLGDSGVGKTALILRYAFGEFDPDKASTVGMEFLFKKVNFQGKDFILKIWDTVGQERFASLSDMYCRDADAAIFCYDITHQHSFLNIKKWLHEYKHKYKLPENCYLVLVGCKSDLVNERVVHTDEGHSMAESLGVKFFETSAMLDNFNVDDIFELVISQLANKEPNCTREKGTVSLNAGTRKNSCKC